MWPTCTMDHTSPASYDAVTFRCLVCGKTPLAAANTSSHTSPQVQTYSSPASPSVVTCRCGCVYYIMPDSTVQCNCGTQHVNGEFGLVSVVPYGSVEPVKKEKVDDAEERLRAKVIPKFNGESACTPPRMPDGMPVLPYFANAPERNAESFRQLKRWVSTNLRSWPVCRFERTPLEMRIEGRAMKDDPYGGEKAVVVFYCANCGAWGR